jgi:hypothetical protein
MIPATVQQKVQEFFDRPNVQAHIAAVKDRVTTEEMKQQIADDLYEMLPRPGRWVLSKEAFQPLVRRYVFREDPNPLSHSSGE